jgi:hypothetical protein
MQSIVEVVMNEEVKVVALKSNKRRINFLLSKIAELQEELRSVEVAEEAFEASRSRNVTKRSKGRPQAKKDQVTEEVDLFANLVKEVVSSSVAEGDAVVSSEEAVVDAVVSSEEAVVDAVVEKPVTKKEKVSKEKKEKKEKVLKPIKHVLSEEEKAAKKAELEQEKLEKAALKKLQLEQAKAEDKLNKAEEKKAQLAAEKQEKLAMAAADKESKKAQLEQAKAEDKALKKQAILDEKNAKKLALLEEKALKQLEVKQAKAENAPKAAPKKKAVVDVKEVAEPVEKVTVSRITINDIKYLKSSTNILYNPDTREEVGLYDPETKTIKPLPDDEEEEMTEDVYESDDE